MISNLEKFLHPKVSVVYRDPNDIVALYKPCGVLSIPNEDEKIIKNSLLNLPYNLKQRCYIFPNQQKFFLLNRLDTPTSGILIGCSSEELSQIIRRVFFEQKVRKEYRAIVKYKKIALQGEFRDILQKSSIDNCIRVKVGKEFPAVTRYNIEKTFQIGSFPLLLLKLEPITGKTHQLRVQCALRQMPIAGDKIYGDFSLNKSLWKFLPQKRLYLQSCAIEFQYNFQNHQYLFLAKISHEF
jgi:23S rRNA-/tRNA-specific pseudouridylate synthase